MPTTGLEPVRRFRHRSLKPACLPIPARGPRPTVLSARGGIRTLTRLPPQDPESCASANSATRAIPLHSGAEGSRTPDLLNAIQALSQLSYSPRGRSAGLSRPGSTLTRSAPRLSISSAGLTGLEPATSGVTDRHSNQTELQPLPRPLGRQERATGLEPATFCMASRRSTN
jgi:hypothetical protein